MAFQYITAKTYALYNVVIGDDWRIKVPVVQSDRETAFDFSGWQAHAQFRNKVNGTLIADFDTYSGTIEFVGGNMFLIRDKDDTNIEPANVVWDCEFLDDLGFRRTLILESPVELKGQVTQ